jgi:RNA polymerase sigma-70 factor (ECF subfamily)
MKEEAFAGLYAAHYRRVRAFCRQVLGSAGPADDAAQDAFVSAYRAFSSYDATQPFIAWILVIARRRCLDLMRRGGLERAHLGSEAGEVAAAEAGDGAGDGLGAMLVAERADAVNAAIAGLPERYRVPLVLAYFGDATYEEIATALGITRTHVGALLCRARQALRQELTREAAT